MCLIVDTNLAGVVFGNPGQNDFRPIIDWLAKTGKLVVGGRLSRELDRHNSVRRFIRVLQQAGRVRVIPSVETDSEITRIADLCVSDDPHIIALARISGARVLCSRDNNLHRDFTNTGLISDPRGRIYQNATHLKLLRRFGHTSACRRSMGG